MRFLSKTAAGGVVTVVAISLASVATSSAAGTRAVRCVGTGDYCAATVSIAHGAVNRRVTVNLTDTDVKLAKVTVRPPASKGAFEISRASYRLGGSQYRFTLNAVRGNPRGARIVLVITGKGARGGDPFAERGVLKRMVPLWLRLPEFRPLVMGFEAAAIGHGGEGALYVTLRKGR